MKVVARNRKAKYDYEILETLEAGIRLSGQETKSCRQGHINLAGAYVSLLTERPVLKNASIAAYAYASGLDNYNPGQDRELLLKKKEIAKVEKLLSDKGVTIVPLEVRSGRRITVLLGIGRGQKRIDKRQKIKERDVKKRLKQGGEY